LRSQRQWMLRVDFAIHERRARRSAWKRLTHGKAQCRCVPSKWS
jgi:hypothetical protein